MPLFNPPYIPNLYSPNQAGGDIIVRDSTGWRRADALQEVTGASDITTTSTSFILATGLTITPEAGQYLAMFAADVSQNSNNAQLHVQFYVGGVAVAGDAFFQATGTITPTTRAGLSLNRIVNPNGSQAVEVRWRVSGATGTMGASRSLHLLRVG